MAVWGARTVAVGGRELILAWTDRELLVHDVPTGTNLCPIPVGEPVLDASVAEPGILIVATEHGLYAYRLSPDASSARGPGGMGKNN